MKLTNLVSLMAVLIMIFGINAYGYYPIAMIETDGTTVQYVNLDDLTTPPPPELHDVNDPDFLTKLIPPLPAPPDPMLYDANDPNFESYLTY